MGSDTSSRATSSSRCTVRNQLSLAFPTSQKSSGKISFSATVASSVKSEPEPGPESKPESKPVLRGGVEQWFWSRTEARRNFVSAVAR